MYYKLLYGEEYGETRSSDRCFLEGHVSSEKSLQMLKDSIMQQHGKHSTFRTMIWQQDGAPPHYCQIVRDCLDDTLFLRWTGHRRTVE